MRIGTEEITREQLAAGEAAMVGIFTAWDVRVALHRAGVTNTERAADRLMQFERKAGRIRAVTNRKWERVA